MNKIHCFEIYVKILTLIGNATYLKTKAVTSQISVSVIGSMNFTSFSKVFLSHQDDERSILKSCMQWKPFKVEKISPRAGLNSGRLGQQACV